MQNNNDNLKNDDFIEISLQISNLKSQLFEINNKLQNIESKKDENTYFLKTTSVLYEYYSDVSQSNNKIDIIKEKQCTVKKNNLTSQHRYKPKTVLDFFGDNNNQEVNNIEKNEIDKEKDKPIFNNKIIKSNISNKRGDMLDQYLNLIDPINSSRKKNSIVHLCQLCNVEMTTLTIDGVATCTECGYTRDIIIDSEKPNYKEPPPDISFFAYKRQNHFTEWLAQFQAKESTVIPEEVINYLKCEIKKSKITDLSKLNRHKVRNMLKKLDLSGLDTSIKFSKYYEHIPHIINRLNGISPLCLKLKDEEKLKAMFTEIQAPFIKYCPKERKNFLSYSYILHKFCQLLDLDEFLPCFSLLKSKEKLQNQDNIWKKICEHLQWEFIPSFID